MDSYQRHDEEGIRPTYHTPTRSAAKVLEEIVAQEKRTGSTSSSSDSRHPSRSMNDNPGPSSPPPLPLHPPTADAATPQRRSAPSHPSSDTQQPRPTTLRDDDVRSNRIRSSKSRSSKHTSKSLPRRLIEELERIEHSNGHRRTSPTGSHPGREETHGRHRSYFSHSRSSSDSMADLLAITTERLSHETIRANEAERQAAEVLALFKRTHEEKVRLERDLRRVQTELGLYKAQLDVAQKEIFKAQETVSKLDRERAAAVEEAARTRDKVHKLSEARAVEHAQQEARWLGFEEGLKLGRMQAGAINDEPLQENRTSERYDEREVSRYTYPEEESVRPTSHKSSSRHRASKRSSEYPDRQPTTKTAPHPTPSVQTRPRRSSSAAPPPANPQASTPDVGQYSQLLPRPTITSPMPVEVPATQPQPAPAMPPHQPPNPIHDHSKRPEKINVQPSRDPNEPIRPISVRNMTPSIRHERIVLPPDNYIPTMGPDSIISLPPPHELSQPVAPEAPPQAQPSRPPSSRPRAGSRAADTASLAYSYTARNNDNDPRKYTTAPSRMSAMSPGSTHLSELGLLSPPREGEIDYRDKGKARDNPARSSIGGSSAIGASGRSPTQRMAEEWRNANKEYLRPTSPFQGERVTSRPPSSASGRQSRRAREIVLPAPLSEVMINTPSKRATHLPPPSELTVSTPPYAKRTTSNNTVPGIEVVTPSTHDSSRMSERTTMDPVLLTPDSAMRVVTLPPSDEQRDGGLGLYYNTNKPGDEERISMVLPDNDLPPRFVPLSPIPGMGNLHSYPAGFGPSIPKDHPGSVSPNFTYPSSPLHRPTE